MRLKSMRAVGYPPNDPMTPTERRETFGDHEMHDFALPPPRRHRVALIRAVVSLALATSFGSAGGRAEASQAPASGGGPSNLAQLSNREIAQLHSKLTREERAAYGQHRRHRITGKITQRLEAVVYVFGRALPAEPDPSAPGIHIDDACLVVKNPKTNGEFKFEWYLSEEKYYAGETTARNAFGARVPCSIYGDLPETVKKAVAEVTRKIATVEQELKRRTTRERELWASLETRVREVENRISAIEKERSEVLSDHGRASAGLDATFAANNKLNREQNGLEREKSELELRQKAVKARVDAVWEGRDVPPIDDFLAQARSEEDGRRHKETTSEAGALRSQIANLEDEVRQLRERLAGETRIHNGNVADMRQSGSNTDREMAYFRERTSYYEKEISKREGARDAFAKQLRAVSGEDAGPAGPAP